MVIDDEYLLGEKIELQEASGPTDIIWENRHWSENDRTKKRLVAYTIILIMLAFAGCIIFWMSKTSTEKKLKYPWTNCVSTQSEYIGKKA